MDRIQQQLVEVLFANGEARNDKIRSWEAKKLSPGLLHEIISSLGVFVSKLIRNERAKDIKAQMVESMSDYFGGMLTKKQLLESFASSTLSPEPKKKQVIKLTKFLLSSKVTDEYGVLRVENFFKNNSVDSLHSIERKYETGKDIKTQALQTMKNPKVLEKISRKGARKIVEEWVRDEPW
eukprot:CAMPEP_0174264904 /NCGR_PEP_ID=MMETSP0439-20130205/24434_1 /TAXON_ID=0 /ORGANISM="Stereomyxa ramosa, Strain Chinc5" /LENGTH=179 /DNA_ID=CAMNT_0015351061 /DNA_START=1338 /DNA_END=1874 /DNA_ORIENTATION=-